MSTQRELQYLAAIPDAGITVNDLAATLGRSIPAVSAMVRRLKMRRQVSRVLDREASRVLIVRGDVQMPSLTWKERLALNEESFRQAVAAEFARKTSPQGQRNLAAQVAAKAARDAQQRATEESIASGWRARNQPATEPSARRSAPPATSK